MLVFEKRVSSDVTPEQEAKKPIPVRVCHVCGASISYCNFLRHTKTKKHKDAEYIQFEKFEMK